VPWRHARDLRRVHVGTENAIELFHGYTYSAHPVACAAGLATQRIYRRDGLLTRASELADYWADGLHSLKGLPHVIDLRNLGLIGAIELQPIAGKPGARGFDMFLRAFEQGLLVRVTGDIIALSAAAHHREVAHRRDLRSTRFDPARAAVTKKKTPGVLAENRASTCRRTV
jgi:adenosylmethionine-8-amino-7-oxononanoate aminotransferase